MARRTPHDRWVAWRPLALTVVGMKINLSPGGTPSCHPGRFGGSGVRERFAFDLRPFRGFFVS